MVKTSSALRRLSEWKSRLGAGAPRRRSRSLSAPLPRPARIISATCVLLVATSACEPADFLAPPGEDAVGAALSALRTFQGGMPHTIRFEGFSSGEELQLVEAVRSFEWEKSAVERRDALSERVYDLELRLQDRSASGYQFEYGFRSIGRRLSQERGSGVENGGLVTTDRVGGTWESSQEFLWCVLMGGRRFSGSRMTKWVMRLQREAYASRGMIVLRPYDIAPRDYEDNWLRDNFSFKGLPENPYALAVTDESKR